MKKELLQFLESYKDKTLDRYKTYNLPPKPLGKKDVEMILEALTYPGLDMEEFSIFETESVDRLIIRFLNEEVRRGSFPETYCKAMELAQIVRGKLETNYLSPERALEMLGDMKGGPAAGELIDLFQEGYFEYQIKQILKDTVLISKKEFDRLADFARERDSASIVIESWARGEFARHWTLKEKYQGKAIKIGDNITTDDLSPSKRANTRTDQPLHALYIMEGREDEIDFMERYNRLKNEKSGEEKLILVAGRALGEGSSRKSAAYTVSQYLGEPVEGEPGKKTGGLVIAESIAPIFENSLVASGILPVKCDTGKIKEGDRIQLDTKEKVVSINNGEEILSVEFPNKYKLKKISAGGMINFDAGSELQRWALNWCKEHNREVKPEKLLYSPATSTDKDKKPLQTLAQKLVAMNRLDDKNYIVPGETAQVSVRGVFSQDTTGPMTIEEYRAMAGEDFGAGFVVQSLCHTGECPSSEERDRHRFLSEFITERGGICLAPGEGIIHTIGNRFVIPTDIIVGGDSHTRTQHGLSFPAASDIVAGAMKYGKIDLTMDESVRVIFNGRPRGGITARDLVSAMVIYAEKTTGKDIYNGKIIEMEGAEFLDNDGRYILTNAVAERSASAGTVVPDELTKKTVEKNLKYIKKRPEGKENTSIKNCIDTMEEYLKDPWMPKPDPGAEYTANIEVPIEEVTEPLVAKPHHPDNVAWLSEVAGREIDEVFIGSCVGGDLEGIREAAKILAGKRISQNVHFVISPAALDIYNVLASDGSIAELTLVGAVIIMPGCGLCMGNKRRIGSGSVAFTTTTRNYRSRIGPPDSETYLGSANVAAVTALLGRIPSREEYYQHIKQ